CRGLRPRACRGSAHTILPFMEAWRQPKFTSKTAFAACEAAIAAYRAPVAADRANSSDLRRLRRVPMALACGTLRALSPTILAHEDLSHARSPEDPQYWHIGTHRLRKDDADRTNPLRSEEHTSELQSRENLGCRLLLEKKKGRMPYRIPKDSVEYADRFVNPLDSSAAIIAEGKTLHTKCCNHGRGPAGQGDGAAGESY